MQLKTNDVDFDKSSISIQNIKSTQKKISRNENLLKMDLVSVDSATKIKLEYVFKIGQEIARFVTTKFEKPVSLEFEKVYCPYLLMNKKRYAGLIYTTPSAPDKIDTKDIETVRRDNCELVKNLIQSCLDCMLYRRDIKGAIELVKETVRSLYLERLI